MLISRCYFFSFRKCIKKRKERQVQSYKYSCKECLKKTSHTSLSRTLHWTNLPKPVTKNLHERLALRKHTPAIYTRNNLWKYENMLENPTLHKSRLCQKSVMDVGTLKRHMRSHKSYICQ